MYQNKDSLSEKAKNSVRESKYLDFKSSFDVNSPKDWCEIIKDIIAMANSGGGVIIFGATNTGKRTDFNIKPVLELDPATITDKINKYTNVNFDDFEMEELFNDKSKFAALYVFSVQVPIPFSKPGTYSIERDKQKNAFSQGTIYFRHGAKSEPCTLKDIEESISRNLESIKKSWLGNIRRVVNAPSGSTVEILPSNVTVSTSLESATIRITDNIDAPEYQLKDPNKTHPFRGKELITILKKEIDVKLNNFHLFCLRKEYNIDERRPDFFYKPKFGSPQYSRMYIDWLIEQYNKDNRIFEKVRKKYLKQ